MMGYPVPRWSWRPRPTIPARPLRFVLIDRQTGTYYRIKPNSGETAPELLVVSKIPTAWVSAVLRTYVVGSTGRQLYVANGVLLNEAAPTGVHGARAMVWSGTKVFEISFDANGNQTWSQIL